MTEISIIYFLQLAWKRIWALIIAAIIFAAAAFGYCNYIVEPQYVARASIIITNGSVFVDAYTKEASRNDTSHTTNISSSLSVIDTVIDVLKTPDLYKQLEDKNPNGKNYGYRSLMSLTSISKRQNDTLFVDVSFKSTNPKHAVSLVNQFASLSCDYVADYILYCNAKVASEAESAAKVYPDTNTTIMLAALIGAALAYLAVFIIDILDKAIKGEEEFVALYDVPLIGVVPDFENGVIISYNYRRKRGNYDAD